jgi:phosphomethylpyrimidine synthase
MSSARDRVPVEMDTITRTPFPASRKVYVPGTLHPDVRVPMREISLHPTATAKGPIANPPVTVYDTSGPFSDPSVDLDLRRGLARVRRAWILARGDVDELPRSARRTASSA